MFPYDSNNMYQQQIQNQLQSMLNNPTGQASIHTVKVNGRAGAESFQMPPNSDALLLDVNEPIVWSVVTDGAGYKTIEPFDISKHKEVKQEDVLKSLDDRISKLEEAMRNGKSNSSNVNTKSKSGEFHNDAGNRSNAQG